jgi:hypothetical protein
VDDVLQQQMKDRAAAVDSLDHPESTLDVL